MEGPGLSYSQRIGTLGERFFSGNHPDSWQEESKPKEGGDFGFDVSMWLTDVEKIRGRFAVQIKSEVNPKPHGGSEPYFSVPLSKKTCELYFQDGQPVMLVFVALQGETKTGAKMYYVWITGEIEKRLSGKVEFADDDPKEMSFRVPLANELLENLDISAYLKDYWDHTRIANSLRNSSGTAALKAVSKLSHEGMSGLSELPISRLDRWIVRSVLGGERPWPTPKDDSLIAKIKSVSENITHGNAEEARRAITEIGDPASCEDDVQAELLYQKGRLAHQDGDTEAALEHFRAASQIRPDSESYFTSEIEAEYILNAGLGRTVSEDTLHRSQQFSDKQLVKFQLMRIHAMAGNRAEAERLLTEMEGFSLVEASVTYHCIIQDWTTALELAQKGLASDPNIKHQRLLTLLKARILLNLVAGDAEGVEIGGRPDLQIEHVEQLRETTLNALRDANLSGWPSNSELLLDCASAVCLISTPDEEVYDLLRDFFNKRPKNRAVQETLARVATLLGKYHIAADVLATLPNQSIEEIARQIMLRGQTGKFSEAVALAIAHLLDAPHSKLVDSAVIVATMSALELGAISEESKLRAYVDSGSASGKTLLGLLEQAEKNPAGVADHLERIWPDVIAEPPDDVLQNNVFLYLRPTRQSEVDRILALGEIIQKRRRLIQSESAKFSAALLNKQRYKDVVDFTDSALKLYPTDENIGITRAIALDALGQTAAAVNVLTSFEHSGRTDILRARSQILLRTGEIDTAVSLIQRALANAKSRKEKFQLQRSLTILYSKTDPSLYLEAAWRLGESSDPTVEEDEGSFLVQFLMASMPMGSEVPESRAEHFHERMKAFVERFPNSHYFRTGSFSDESGDDALTAIRKMAGITEERLALQERQRNFGERSGSLIPMVMRPGGYAPFCTNIVDLLNVCFRGKHDGQSSRITVGAGDLEQRPVDKAPILDLTTVVILVQLNLFDKLFRMWNAIAIPKASLDTLSRLGMEFIRAGANELVDKVLAEVKNNIQKVLQPGAIIKEGNNFAASEFETISDEVRDGQYEFLTADVAAYVYIEGINGHEGQARSLWDFLRAAEKAGVITSTEHRLARLQVASWNSYGAPITAGDVAAAAVGIAYGTKEGDVEASICIVKQFFEGASADDMVRLMAAILVGILATKDAQIEKAAEWLVRVAFSELLLARHPGFPGTADKLAGRVLSLIAFSGDPHDAAGVRVIYRAMSSVRLEFSGNPDEEFFLRLLGGLAAEIFHKLYKNGNRASVEQEAKMMNNLFCCVSEGTSDHEKLTNAFYDRTKELQQR